MSIMVDDRPLAAEPLGLRTIGQLLTHIQKNNRLITHMLIDGQEPDLARLGSLKQKPLDGHTLYIETTEPRRMALEVLAAVEAQLREGVKRWWLGRAAKASSAVPAPIQL